MASARRTEPEANVRHGWTRVSTSYRPNGSGTDAFGHSFADHEEWLRPFFRFLDRGSEILDLGCGCGIPDSKLLSDQFRVTGVDISDVQIERARRLVPNARFLRGDTTSVRFLPEAFAGVVCLYSLIHVPLDEQPTLLARMHRWLRPGGLLLVTIGEEAYTGIEPNWPGSNAKTYWSHADAATYARWLTGAGFEIVRRSYIARGESGHALFLARKPADAARLRPQPLPSP